MRKKRFIVKEVTCDVCNGYGVLEDEYGHLSDYPEDICPECKGKGYITSEIDRLTGYQVITLEEAN